MKKISIGFIGGLLRIAIVTVMIIAQIVLVIGLVSTFRNQAIWAYALIDIALVATMIVLVSRNKNSSYTIAWVALIALVPLLGYVLYMMWGRSDTDGKRNKRVKKSLAYGEQFLPTEGSAYAKLAEENPSCKRISRYLERQGFPVYENTACTYYPLGEKQFDALIEDLQNAKKFIFIETFILAEGKIWDRLEKILLKKAAEGVEIRLMYDDLGSLLTFPLSNGIALRRQGIQVVRYNPIHKYTRGLAINYRNHQKITVIDGHIAYTGGTNLADEYANFYPKHGHWKDTAIRLEGDAVWSMTVIFLQMWDGEVGTFSDYPAYRSAVSKISDGFFQPFADGPVNNPNNPAEDVYRQMIAGAQNSLYLTSPYFVVDNTMLDLLCAAAASGVDVRLITPKIWDHWFVRIVSRSYYQMLLNAGIRIYEYTPGFIHAKMILADDRHCVMGSINLDYRSFYHHFENGVWICQAEVLDAIGKDFTSLFEQSEEITFEWVKSTPLLTRFLGSVLRLFAVLF